MAGTNRAVISIIGPDQKGVVAKFATFLAEHGLNNEDMEQQVVQGRFIMDMLVTLSDTDLPMGEMVRGLTDVGAGINMSVQVAPEAPSAPKRVAALVSTEPCCLEHLLQHAQSDRFRQRAEIVCVLSDHPDLEPVAEAAGVEFEHQPCDDKAAHMRWLLDRLQSHKVELVVLGRYMQILSPELVAAWTGRIINVHPSLQQRFPGPSPYREAHGNGTRMVGCTAHFVTEALDEGPIILQDVLHINVGQDTVEDVQRNGQALEGRVLCEAAQMFLDEKLVVIDGKVVYRPGLSMFLFR